MTASQLSACVVAGAIVFGCMLVCFQLGRYDAAVRIRSACDVDQQDRIHLKPGYYAEVSRAQFR